MGQNRSSLEGEALFLSHDVVNPRRPHAANARHLQTELTQTSVHLHDLALANVCAQNTTQAYLQAYLSARLPLGLISQLIVCTQ